jgi:hypothetical protein
MLMGTVNYDLKGGRHIKMDWTARMYLVDGKISFYQVYIDATPTVVAQGKTIKEDNGEIIIV